MQISDMRDLADDPVAQKVAWEPLVPGGTNFCTHTLKSITPKRMQFKATMGALLFGWAFFLAGLGTMGLSIWSKVDGTYSTSTEFPFWVVALVATVFLGFGCLMLWSLTQPIVFDKGTGVFRRGFSSPSRQQARGRNDCAPLEDIHALQIVTEVIKTVGEGRSKTYSSYELNLVLNDASRINVVDHGNQTQMMQDSDSLAKFLNVPLWRDSDYKN